MSKSFSLLPERDEKLMIMHVNVMMPWALKKLMRKNGLVAEFYSGKSCLDKEMIVIGSKAEE